jgi:hypothetical protein
MDRSEFIRTFLIAPAAIAGFGADFPVGAPEGGIRRLSREKSFTIWSPDMKPAYRVKTGETVIVDMSHGMPGLVTREGVFREAGPGAIINPQTGPIFVEGIEPGDAVAIDILDIKTGDWGYCSGRIFEIREG